MRDLRGVQRTVDLAVTFAVDSAKIDAPSRKKLMKLAADVRANTGIRQILLSGRADGTGATDYNMKLSGLRARTVYEFLRDAGVDSELMQVVALGEMASGDSPVHRSVEISLIR